jgi:hypothetical protein
MQHTTDHVEEAYTRTFGSSAFTRAPYHRDRATVDNERAKQERTRRYGPAEPASMADYRALEPDATVTRLQDLEREIWALGREKRRMDAAAFVKRLAKSSEAHKARVAGRSRRHARSQAERARYDDDDAENDAERDAALLEEELEKLDDGLWDPKVRRKGRGCGPSTQDARARNQSHSARWHQERLARQMIRDERSDPAFRLPPSAAWEETASPRPGPSPSSRRNRAAAAAVPTSMAPPMTTAAAPAMVASGGPQQQRPDTGRYGGSWVGMVGSGAHWVGSEPSAQAEVLSLRHSIEVQQLHTQQMLQELQARQIVESELEWQLMQRMEQQQQGYSGYSGDSGYGQAQVVYPSDPYGGMGTHGGCVAGAAMGAAAEGLQLISAGASWPALPFDDNEAEPYPLDCF